MNLKENMIGMILGRRGGSLEKGIADLSELESELDAGGLVNMYWVGRISRCYGKT